MITPTLEQLEEAVTLRTQINEMENRLRSFFTEMPVSRPGAAESRAPARRKSTMSVATRAKLAAAARARWAAAPVGSGTLPARKGGAAKRKGLTAAGRRKLSLAMKNRWAAKRAGRK